MIRLHAADNVAIARVGLAAGDALRFASATLAEDVPAGHKIALRRIEAGQPVVKDNEVIGHAARAIDAGARVRPADVVPAATPPQAPLSSAVQPVAAAERARFLGYARPDGRVGTRNFIAVLVTVNCAATTARMIADHFTAERLAAYANVDGVVALTHELGCGMEMTGEPMDLLRRTIAGYVRHPNVGGAVLCSLGCERNNIYGLLEKEKLAPGPRLATLVMQEKGGTRKTADEGIAAVEAMLPLVNDARRESVSAAHLVVGLQGSGSDAFSELTTNPALGAAVDLLIGHGGTAIVSGTSELHGMERALEARAASGDVAARLGRRMQWWKEYNAGRDTPFNGRLTRSALAGGFTTALERAAAAAKRWGRSPLAEVYEYAWPVTARGLVFMDTPSHEAVAATGQIAGGANLVCMAAGHGTGFGSLPAPTIKLASHTALYRRMRDDFDLDCGPILDGEASVEAMGERIFQAMLRHASGGKTRGEELGVGENEFVPWPIGLTA
ncbi:MAG TPA: altronate dehydratase family protein [Usitatibacter sp.]|nr:altronate dehydratase family protein [Usitatibacter sp.]